MYVHNISRQHTLIAYAHIPGPFLFALEPVHNLESICLTNNKRNQLFICSSVHPRIWDCIKMLFRAALIAQVAEAMLVKWTEQY